LEYLKLKPNAEIEFIALSHFHFDHFSGMADIFDHCIKEKLKVKYFFHSLAPFLSIIYNRIFTSQKIQAEIERFLNKYEDFDDIIDDAIPVSRHLSPIELSEKTFLTFLAPAGRIYSLMARQLSRKENQVTTTIADVNKLSTIICIQKESRCILLTSDAPKKSFKRINIAAEITLVQAPHHGSWRSIDQRFWLDLKKTANCPCVFSVGDEPKDKLPNEETVTFFDTNNYKVYSTNPVYGINSYFKLSSLSQAAKTKSSILNTFSKLNSKRNAQESQFAGDCQFTVLK
jgi:hypothetical protein